MFLACLLFACFQFPTVATAQPQLDFKRIINNWPTIELYFTVSCNGLRTYTGDKKHFSIRENELPVTDFDLWCPDTVSRVAASTVLLFDESGSMLGAGITDERRMGNTFIDLMDGIIDEAAILSFASTTSRKQMMTTYLDLLHNAVNTLSTHDSTAVWDACFEAVLEVRNNSSVNSSRAVLLFSDGEDKVSRRTLRDVITFAISNQLRVYTIGVGSRLQADTLQTLAVQTGGRYLERPTATDLVALYVEITTEKWKGPVECIITYQSVCEDGSVRTVDLSLDGFCNGKDIRTRTYKSPRYPPAFSPLNLAIATREAKAGNDITVPVELLDTLRNEFFNRTTIKILYDTTALRYTGIDIPLGSPLQGMPLNIVEHGDTIVVQTLEKRLIDVSSAPAILLNLRFKVRDSDQTDTLCTPIAFLECRFEAGCFQPVLKNGEVCILPKQPTGVSDVGSLQPTLEIYPQPSGEWMTVLIHNLRAGHHQLDVSDVNGRLVLRRAYQGRSEICEPVDLSDLRPGVYIARLLGEAAELRRVVVKLR